MLDLYLVTMGANDEYLGRFANTEAIRTALAYLATLGPVKIRAAGHFLDTQGREKGLTPTREFEVQELLAMLPAKPMPRPKSDHIQVFLESQRPLRS